jgi:SAM-dependent methyltransferase
MRELTDRRYWDHLWTHSDEGAAQAPGISVVRDQHQAHLARLFAERLAPGRRFLEIGAGGSAWPAWVAAHLGAEAWGIDFSRPGLELAARAAKALAVETRLVEGDLFDRDALPAAAFDVVYSGGFVEHFTDAQPVMERLGELVAPGGVVVTTVPNLGGINGLLQRLVDADCFARHVVFTPAGLDEAHAAGGLVPVAPAEFFGVFDPGSVNFVRQAARLPPFGLRILWAGLSLGRRSAERLAGSLGLPHGGRLLAPNLIGIYRQSSGVTRQAGGDARPSSGRRAASRRGAARPHAAPRAGRAAWGRDAVELDEPGDQALPGGTLVGKKATALGSDHRHPARTVMQAHRILRLVAVLSTGAATGEHFDARLGGERALVGAVGRRPAHGPV